MTSVTGIEVTREKNTNINETLTKLLASLSKQGIIKQQSKSNDLSSQQAKYASNLEVKNSRQKMLAMTEQKKRELDFSDREIKRDKQRLPDFIIIGAKKCGTGALARFLDWHSKINKPK